MAAKKKSRAEIPHLASNEITDADCNAAQRILEMDYMNDVRGCAKEVAERLKDDPDQEFSEVLDEVVDGTQRVIYTFQAKLGLIFSNHTDAYFEDFGNEGACDKDGIKWERLCFVAMTKDVIDELDARGFDVNDPRSWADFDLKEFD